ncbi:MAG: polysaccharide biosynthesis C-terminal domain-containing protein, partial [Nitrospirae bacterium]|nr:polysaccharide biosynthesis C-terminal domain-containing protein [Nitrospirota bacterium]
GLIALRFPIVSTLYQRGKFGAAATLGTADALMFYSVGIWAMVGVRVISATFYSMQDTRTPVVAAGVTMVINVLLSLLLMGPLKHGGLALANALAASCNFTMLFFFLRRKLGGIGTGRIVFSFIKTLCASSVMGLAGWYIASYTAVWSSGGQGLFKATYLGATMFSCLIIYAATAYVMKSEEIGYIIDKVKSRK